MAAGEVKKARLCFVVLMYRILALFLCHESGCEIENCKKKGTLTCIDCQDRFSLSCVGLAHPPPMEWKCPQCQDEETLYCICQQGEYGLMDGCDGSECRHEWFHLQCVGLKRTPPEEVWFCPECKLQQ
ncbi:inhibitor of growth protein 5-like [Montipora capricornis]|uniref:inhibitor of growth protein 5-like n=1 Tax=Montipora capricornis TaxID=246305 RepID=UPI0035F1CB6C